IEAALEAFEARPVTCHPADIARAGVFVSINPEGALRVDRGYVRPEDEPASGLQDPEGDDAERSAGTPSTPNNAAGSSAGAEPAEEEDGIKPLPDRLVTDL